MGEIHRMIIRACTYDLKKRKAWLPYDESSEESDKGPEDLNEIAEGAEK
jgi:hypothetical protein